MKNSQETTRKRVVLIFIYVLERWECVWWTENNPWESALSTTWVQGSNSGHQAWCPSLRSQTRVLKLTRNQNRKKLPYKSYEKTKTTSTMGQVLIGKLTWDSPQIFMKICFLRMELEPSTHPLQSHATPNSGRFTSLIPSSTSTCTCTLNT